MSDVASSAAALPASAPSAATRPSGFSAGPMMATIGGSTGLVEFVNWLLPILHLPTMDAGAAMGCVTVGTALFHGALYLCKRKG